MNRSPSRKILFALFLPFFLLSCSKEATYRQTTFAMDTSVVCQAKTRNEEELKDVLSTFEEVEAYADATTPHYSVVGVYEVNQASSPVEIGEDLYDLLSFSLSMKEATKGYFNPYCLGLSTLWKERLHPKEEGQSASLPSDEEIKSEVAKIKNTSLNLAKEGGRCTAYLQEEDPAIGRASLDLGGIAKGYAAKKAKEKAASYGWTHFYLNGGSSTMVLGENEENEGYYTISWRKDLPGKKMKAKNASLSTSSVSEQGVEIEGKVYSHLINPFTGEASPSITGVTLLGEDPALLDAFSTALMWMGEENRVELEKEYGIQALYYKDGKVVRDGIGLLQE